MSQQEASYIAVIPDGNARWAKSRGVPTLAGHQAGADAIKECVKNSVQLGIKELTVWSFSTENWSRPQDEVDGLMELFAHRIDLETPELDDQDIRMRFIGSRDHVSPRLLDRMEWAQDRTANNKRMTFYVAFNYGGRAEILEAAKRFDEGGQEKDFRSYLYAPEMHDPDLIIRTSGERRVSNFLLWQGAYSELFFSDVLWPDFAKADLEMALADFRERKRRFGGR